MGLKKSECRVFTVSLTGDIIVPPLGTDGVVDGNLRLDIKCSGKFCKNDLANITAMIADFVVAQVESLLTPDIETSGIEGLKLLQGGTLQ